VTTSQSAPRDLLATMSSWRERYETSPTGRALDRLGLPAMLILGVIFGIGQALHLTQKPLDFVLYWKATNFADLYPPNWLSNDYAYVYPPPMAQLLLPFHVLPFEVAAVGWSIVCFASMWYVARAWSLPLIALGLVGAAFGLSRATTVFLEYVLLGNIQWPMAAGIVLAMRAPAAWAIPILTKIGPGIGALWLVFKRDWIGLRTALLATFIIAAVSFILAPAAWIEFVTFSVENYGGPSIVPIIGPPLPVRLVAAAALVWIAARADQRWLVYIAAGIAIPALYEWSFLPVWIATLRGFGLRRRQPAVVTPMAPVLVS
jgi:hypothetical protein